MSAANGPYTKNKIAELGLDINHVGLNIVDDDKKVVARYYNSGNILRKYINVEDYGSLKDALIAADQYNRFFRTNKRFPRVTFQKLIEYGFSIDDDYRCITYNISGRPGSGMGRWVVRQGGDSSGSHQKSFSFPIDSKSEARLAMKSALKYRQEIMGDLLKVNPKTKELKFFEKVIGRKSTGKLIKGLRYKKTKDGIVISVQTGKSLERIGLVKSWSDFKKKVREAIKVRNSYLGLNGKTTIEPAAANLRREYLKLAGL